MAVRAGKRSVLGNRGERPHAGSTWSWSCHAVGAGHDGVTPRWHAVAEERGWVASVDGLVASRFTGALGRRTWS